MNRKFTLLLSGIVAVAVSACASPGVHSADQAAARRAQVRQCVAVALTYHDQGGYEKSAELFLEAAGLFRDLGLDDEQRRALVAAAKVQLKSGDREAFALTMARYKTLLGRYTMPADDERFLVNLSDRLKGRPLTYPVAAEHRAIFE